MPTKAKSPAPKRGILARMLGLPAKKPAPRIAKSRPSAPLQPAMTAKRHALIKEAMNMRTQVREELGEDEVKRLAKAVTGKEDP